METGIFLIGKSLLSQVGFSTYIGYELGLNGVEILNKLKIAKNHEDGAFLVCLKGDDLEEKLKISIEQGKKRCTENNISYGYNPNTIALAPQLNFYKLIRFYERPEDAQNSFLELSNKPYQEIIKHVENIAPEAKSDLREKGITPKDIEDLEDSDLR